MHCFLLKYIPSHLAMVKSGGLRFQFCQNAAIDGFWYGLVFNSHSGNNIPYTLSDELYVNVFLRVYLDHIPVHVIETILKHEFRLVRALLNRP
jgi:hypothetical protein